MTHLPILSNHVDIWMQDIREIRDDVIEERTKCLSIDERERASRFVHRDDAKRLIIAYSGLRSSLANYLSLPMSSFQFETNSHGKPYLSNSTICFNLSHSKDWVIWAFAFDNEIGIDIEFQRNNVEVMSLAQRFFSKEEYTALQNVKAADRLFAFYRCWTRKEAFIKAIGKGLSYPLHNFAVPIQNKIIGQEICAFHDKISTQKWYLYSLEMPSEYTAALVLQKRVKHIQYKKHVCF